MKTEREKKLAAVWRHMHRDYKGVTDGVRSVMIWRNGTTLVPLDQLTDAEIESHLPKERK